MDSCNDRMNSNMTIASIPIGIKIASDNFDNENPPYEEGVNLLYKLKLYQKPSYTLLCSN
jgi:hypothetical protein